MNKNKLRKYKILTEITVFLLMIFIIIFLLGAIIAIWLFFIFSFETTGIIYPKIIATLIILATGVIVYALKEKDNKKNKKAKVN